MSLKGAGDLWQEGLSASVFEVHYALHWLINSHELLVGKSKANLRSRSR
ncbi:hypothetical protein DFR28_101290 [Arenicella xantha]|uniref:Uncharacterized protein n=1 Tax=Arenicella xantha TaxID=644221 RepID=A0A395JR24_9GAMM|nr:hypothetical protein DFR28_101290 [Arenicella xantha]